MSGIEVKICGLRTVESARAACRAGAEYAGVVFAERLRRVTCEEAARVVAVLNGGTRAVGVFVDTMPSDILLHRDVAGFDIVQLHGSESPSDCQMLRTEGLTVWKAIRPMKRQDLVDAWARYAAVSDAILVEGFSVEAAGGTGSTFPYDWLTGLDRNGPRLVLAGGLTTKNVCTAIEKVRPDIVDVSSAVEDTPGVKSPNLIAQFVSVVKDPV